MKPKDRDELINKLNWLCVGEGTEDDVEPLADNILRGFGRYEKAAKEIENILRRAPSTASGGIYLANESRDAILRLLKELQNGGL